MDCAVAAWLHCIQGPAQALTDLYIPAAAAESHSLDRRQRVPGFLALAAPLSDNYGCMLQLVFLDAGHISWSFLLLQTFVDAIFNFCQDSPLTVGGEWLSTGRGAGTAARLPKVHSSCVLLYYNLVTLRPCHFAMTAVSYKRSQVSATTMCRSASAPGGAELLGCQTIVTAMTLTCTLAMPCQSASGALMLQSSPRPSVIPEGSWDVGALSYILQEPKVGLVTSDYKPVCRSIQLLTMRLRTLPGDLVRFERVQLSLSLQGCHGLCRCLLCEAVQLMPSSANSLLHVPCVMVAVLTLPPILQGKAKERHELFSQGQSLSDIALATAQVAGKPPTVRNILLLL